MSDTKADWKTLTDTWRHKPTIKIDVQAWMILNLQLHDVVLLLAHQASSVTGRIGAILGERGYTLDRRCLRAANALPLCTATYAAVVSFGGPMSANDCGVERIRQGIRFIPSVLAAGGPISAGASTGGCLPGFRKRGHEAHENGITEAGYTRIHPSASGRDWFGHSRIFYQWDREGFGVPTGATLLATGDMFSNQVFVYGENVLETQFHPETPATRSIAGP